MITAKGVCTYACLEGTSWHAGDMNGPRNQTNTSNGHADGSMAQMNASSVTVLNSAETAVAGRGMGPQMPQSAEIGL